MFNQMHVSQFGEKKRKILAGLGFRVETPQTPGCRLNPCKHNPVPSALFEGCLQAFSCLLAKTGMQSSNLLQRVGFCNTSTKPILAGLQHLTCVTANK